ncbi:DUF3168 domain-containing protein [Pseudaestuariivita atlantica]|uniref:Gene transfer agent protein n=1 Tax=Pseudaestuariivita atlantica TaxID=1317121 RepID=A0A0L1JM08_9RHOB|nr:DUF3168 domain-containing protein [Pseudaestuariivita atlantica]KNG92762.1 gene transfer agent protein [Pseudaestuariivita atlantica]
MSYGVAEALQAAVYARLAGDAGVMAEVGSSVYDALPSGTAPSLYVALGPERVTDRSDKTGRGARHDFVVSVVTSSAGFQSAKAAAAAVGDALIDADLVLSRGRLVSLNFVKAAARREDGNALRRIDLTFRARVEDT